LHKTTTVAGVTLRTRHLLFPGSALLLVMGLLMVSGNALAGRPASHPAKAAPGVSPDTNDAYLFLRPSATSGSCPAPENGGTTSVGCRFVFDLMLNAGSNDDLVAHQSVLTFTNSILQNARVPSIGTSCVLTNTVTWDLQTFDTVLRNEVCNGPGRCVFRGMIFDPGFMAPSSCTFFDPFGFGGVFRVAQVGLCASAPGQAVLRWQFTPTDFERDTEIVNMAGEFVHNPSQFTDYVINVVPPPPTTPLIIGHVNWQGAPAQPHPRQQQPVTLTIKMGTTEVNFPLQNTDTYGYFTDTLPALATGVYNWRVKGPRSLANSGTVSLTGSPVTNLEAGLMRAGDANDDNVVNVTDFTIMRNTFGKSLGQSGYDGRADFNSDELVNVLDVTLHKANNGLGGAPPIGPGGAGR
jgi:hypothetical protein